MVLFHHAKFHLIILDGNSSGRPAKSTRRRTNFGSIEKWARILTGVAIGISKTFENAVKNMKWFEAAFILTPKQRELDCTKKTEIDAFANKSTQRPLRYSDYKFTFMVMLSKRKMAYGAMWVMTSTHLLWDKWFWGITHSI